MTASWLEQARSFTFPDGDDELEQIIIEETTRNAQLSESHRSDENHAATPSPD